MTRTDQARSQHPDKLPVERPAERSSTGATSSTPLLLLAAVALGLAFWLYAQPGVAVMLAEQLWSCF